MTNRKKPKKIQNGAIPWEEALTVGEPLDLPEVGIRVERRGSMVCFFLDSLAALSLARQVLPPPPVRGVTACGTSECWCYLVEDDAV